MMAITKAAFNRIDTTPQTGDVAILVNAHREAIKRLRVASFVMCQAQERLEFEYQGAEPPRWDEGDAELYDDLMREQAKIDAMIDMWEGRISR